MASIKQRKSKFSVIYWYMDGTGERKQKWDTLETKKEAKIDMERLKDLKTKNRKVMVISELVLKEGDPQKLA